MDNDDIESVLKAKQLKFSQLYRGKLILAPMVRVNKLPFRLLALKYKADLVYSEELIDYKLSTCTRVLNKDLNTVDFVDKNGDIIFQTCDEERCKVIVQLGSNNPDRALMTANLLKDDIAGIDFNFGCPKSFSLKGGMGSALLEKPEQIEAILKHCVYHLDIPVTCKIRVLDNLDKTIELAKLIERCGVAAIAVHGRTKNERPNNSNRIDYIKAIVDALQIPVIANGSSALGYSWYSLEDSELRNKTTASSIMVARDMMRCPASFDANKSNTIETLIRQYIKLSYRYNNRVYNVKYVIQSMRENIGSSTAKDARELTNRIHSCKSLRDVCLIFGLENWFDEEEVLRKTKSDSLKINHNDETRIPSDEISFKKIKLDETLLSKVNLR